MLLMLGCSGQGAGSGSTDEGSTFPECPATGTGTDEETTSSSGPTSCTVEDTCPDELGENELTWTNGYVIIEEGGFTEDYFGPEVQVARGWCTVVDVTSHEGELPVGLLTECENEPDEDHFDFAEVIKWRIPEGIAWAELEVGDEFRGETISELQGAHTDPFTFSRYWDEKGVLAIGVGGGGPPGEPQLLPSGQGWAWAEPFLWDVERCVCATEPWGCALRTQHAIRFTTQDGSWSVTSQTMQDGLEACGVEYRAVVGLSCLSDGSDCGDTDPPLPDLRENHSFRIYRQTK